MPAYHIHEGLPRPQGQHHAALILRVIDGAVVQVQYEGEAPGDKAGHHHWAATFAGFLVGLLHLEEASHEVGHGPELLRCQVLVIGAVEDSAHA